jgi:hypothetical protein
VLDGLQRKDAQVAVAAHFAAFVGRAEGVRAVFDDLGPKPKLGLQRNDDPKENARRELVKQTRRALV